MADHYNERPEYTQGRDRKGRKVKAVKIRCEGEVKRNGGKRFVAVKVPPCAPVFTFRAYAAAKVHVSRIADVRFSRPSCS